MVHENTAPRIPSFKKAIGNELLLVKKLLILQFIVSGAQCARLSGSDIPGPERRQQLPGPGIYPALKMGGRRWFARSHFQTCTRTHQTSVGYCAPVREQLRDATQLHYLALLPVSNKSLFPNIIRGFIS